MSTEPSPRGAGVARWILAAAVVAVVSGWAFVLWHHRFRPTAPAVMLMLGWVTVVGSVYFLWRTADNRDLDDRQDWWRPAGRLEELQREKRSLLKAIKETELDRDTGKLSGGDADDLIARYRARAIELIKAIEALEAGAPAGDDAVTLRDRIEREIRARVEVGRAAAGRARRRDA